MTPHKLYLIGRLEQVFAGQSDVESFRFSVEVAIYWFAYHYHEGQASELYAILSTSPYRPCCLTRAIDAEIEDDELAQEMYEYLVTTVQ